MSSGGSVATAPIAAGNGDSFYSQSSVSEQQTIQQFSRQDSFLGQDGSEKTARKFTKAKPDLKIFTDDRQKSSPKGRSRKGGIIHQNQLRLANPAPLPEENSEDEDDEEQEGQKSRNSSSGLHSKSSFLGSFFSLLGCTTTAQEDVARSPAVMVSIPPSPSTKYSKVSFSQLTSQCISLLFLTLCL